MLGTPLYSCRVAALPIAHAHARHARPVHLPRTDPRTPRAEFRCYHSRTHAHDTPATPASHARNPALIVQSCGVTNRVRTRTTSPPQLPLTHEPPRYSCRVAALLLAHTRVRHACVQGTSTPSNSGIEVHKLPWVLCGASGHPRTRTTRPPRPPPAHEEQARHARNTAADRASVHTHDTPAPRACYGQVHIASPVTFLRCPPHKRTKHGCTACLPGHVIV
jgi:hypothetical protein